MIRLRPQAGGFQMHGETVGLSQQRIAGFRHASHGGDHDQLLCKVCRLGHM
jgi:hypothetical protein